MFRRRRLAAALPDDGGAGRWAPTSLIGTPVNPATPHPDGQTGWAPFGHGQAAHEQIGAYAAPPLNFYPALINEAQKWNGVSGLDPHWYVPSRTYVLPEQGVQFTGAVPSSTNDVGGQRRGMQFSGLVGPISARLMRARQTAAAVQQTKLIGDVSDLVGSWYPAPTVMSSGEE